MLRIYDVYYEVRDSDGDFYAAADIQVLAKNRIQAIKTVVKDYYFDNGEWVIEKITAKLASSQKARLL